MTELLARTAATSLLMAATFLAYPAAAQAQWHPGMIDQTTRAIAVDARRQFRQCIGQQIEQLPDDIRPDPRQLTNDLINQCATALEPISHSHQQAEVPEAFTQQF
jgi:hypothetical protein